MPSDVPILADGAEELGIALNEAQLQQFARYMSLLMDWSQRVSLTAVKDEEGIQRRHFLESAALVKILRDHGVSLQDKMLIDIGSGAGIPGIPLRIIEPTLSLTLVEAKQRKAAFLETLLAELGLADVEVVTKRAEEVAHDLSYRETYDFVTAKALAALRTLGELTLPFARLGGVVVAPKGKEAAGEVKEAQRALTALNASVTTVERIPLAQADQFVVLLTKDLPTPDRFPRRPGMPAKRPL
jgi:16S rRNA (guanine527-N7)-methyltransferase